MENLESRRLLATFTVSVNSDGAIAPNGGGLTLREAIAYVNQTASPLSGDLAHISGSIGQDDSIVFASGLNGGTINLNPNFGSLVITKPVNIFGPTNNITIQPQFTPTDEMYGLIYSFLSGDDSVLIASNLNITGFTSGVRVNNLSSGSNLYVLDSSLGGNNAIANGQPLIGGAGIEVLTSEYVSVQNSSVSLNRRYGVYVHDTSSSNLISLQSNVISGNTFAGVFFENADRPFNIGGNDIIDTLSGPGIRILDSAHSADSRIEAGNIIADNGLSGILLTNANYPNLIIQQNAIGTDFAGNDKGNGGSGISASDSQLQAIQQNTIGFNGGSGINLIQTNGVSIAQNNIGTDTNLIENSSDLGNGGHGIALADGTEDTVILDNAIAYNAGDGIAITDDVGDADQGLRNIAYFNDFWENSGLPIDLNSDGPTLNDEDDGDNGPNRLLNTPELLQSSLTFSSGVWQLRARIDVDAVGDYAIELFRYDPVRKAYLSFQPALFPNPHLFNVGSLVSQGPDVLLILPLVDGVDVVAGDQITATLIGDSGANENNTSEMSSPVILDVTAPRITDVQLSGSSWLRDPYSYATIVPTGKQLAPIYTQDVNTLQIEFNEHVFMDGSELTLRGSNGTVVAHNGYSFDPLTHVATWTFLSALPRDKYRIELSTAVEDAAGNALDGDWTNVTNGTFDDFNDLPGHAFPSGDGVAGSINNRFEFWFSILPGDSNQDGRVTSADVGSALQDINGDGAIDSFDDGIVSSITYPNDRLIASKLKGDYDDNEIVNQLDYMLWKMTYGNVSPQDMCADGYEDNIIDAVDYTVWGNDNGTYSGWYTGPLPGSGGGGLPVVIFGEAPRVADVTISGSNSTHAPYSFATATFDDPTTEEVESISIMGTGRQLRTVPVGAADTISITFTEDVNITAECLELVGLRTANRPTLAEFTYDLGTMTATWRFVDWAFADQYAITLSDAVTDVEGYQLDGEWVNAAINDWTPVPASSQFPSGNGYAGGDFNFVAVILPGDASLNGYVDSVDYELLTDWDAAAIFQSGDFNGDGLIDSADFDIYTAHETMDLSWVRILADLNGDLRVDELDADILYDNWYNQLQNPTEDDGDLDGDGDIDIDDLDLVFAQWGLALEVA